MAHPRLEKLLQIWVNLWIVSNQVTGGAKNTYNAATGNTDTEPINKTHKTQNK